MADSAGYSLALGEFHEYSFEVDATASLDFRATISWIDPPALSISSTQLVNNLDLVVLSPSGEEHTMWESGLADEVNNNERVLIPAADVESGTYTVKVSADGLTTAAQKYSLVVNGAIVPLSGSSEPPSDPSPVPPSSSSGNPSPSAPQASVPPAGSPRDSAPASPSPSEEGSEAGQAGSSGGGAVRARAKQTIVWMSVSSVAMVMAAAAFLA